MSIEGSLKKVTTQTVRDAKVTGTRLTMLTAYDFTMARLLDRAGIDILLVGDSLGMVIAGYETTLPVTVDQMIYHSGAVVRGTSRAMVITDLPFMSYQVTAEEALVNAGRIMKESGVSGVKLEGGKAVAATINKIVSAGIPVMGHLGLTPQSIHQFGSYKVRAKEKTEAEQLIFDARALEAAGCFALVLEKVPAQVAAQVTASLSIPTIGIGAGPSCDGQVLVSYDMLGLFTEFKPRFARRYDDLGSRIIDAAKQYGDDVRNKKFPSAEESY